jgi:hypothetical protein
MNEKITPIDAAVLQELATFTTPSVSNGIETFRVRPRNEGFMDASVRCVFPKLGSAVGYGHRLHPPGRGGGTGRRR